MREDRERQGTIINNEENSQINKKTEKSFTERFGLFYFNCFFFVLIILRCFFLCVFYGSMDRPKNGEKERKEA